MDDIGDQLTYLEHCRQKMLLALRNKQWADAATFAEGISKTVNDLSRLFLLEAQSGRD